MTVPKPLVLTQHARDAVEERKIELGWIERAVRAPEWAQPDPYRAGVERRFRAIPEYGGRVLRVACFEIPLEIRILTVFFDRRARPPS
jgi:hypothetical protein